MKKTTLFTLLLIPTIIVQAISSARAQSDDKLVITGLDSGKKCMSYTLDVPTLADNDHRIYWKHADCIIIHITNNPFRYTYKATVDDEKIAEDDVIGSLGSLFGLKSITSTNQTPKKAPATPAQGAQPSASLFNEELEVSPKKNVRPKVTEKVCTKAEESKWLEGAKSKVVGYQTQFDLIEPSVELLKTSAQRTNEALMQKDSEYERYLTSYLVSYKTLVEAPSSSDDAQKALKAATYKLQEDALKHSIDLTGDKPFEASLVNGFASAQAADTQLRDLSFQIPTGPTAPGCKLSEAGMKEQADLTTKLAELSDKIRQATFDVQSAAVDIANQTCHYQERKKGEYSWVHDKVYESVSTILGNPDVFEAYVKREGPPVDPMSAVLTITRDVTSNDTTTSITDSDSSALDCAADPSTVFKSKKPAKTLADIPAPRATPSADDTKGDTKGGMKNASNGDGKKPKGSSTSSKTQGPSTITLEQPWIFGRPRLVLSGGLTVGILDDKQYQRSTSSGGNAVVGLKTNQRERLAPMLYGHVLLGYARHDADAWYGTLGVTAKSDNQSTDPEFLLGFSRSVAQQRFFLTAGAYIGEKQTLDGGWQLGQTIPSSFTGELPVTKGYHVGWGVGISYRFASTKDPQKDASTKTTGNSTKKSK